MIARLPFIASLRVSWTRVLTFSVESTSCLIEQENAGINPLLREKMDPIPKREGIGTEQDEIV